MSSIHPDLEVEPLPQDRLLAFIEAVGTATVEGHTFEICRSLSGMTVSFHEKVDGLTVIHTLDLRPAIQAALEAIVKEES